MSAVVEDFFEHGTDDQGVSEFTKGLKREGVVDGVSDLGGSGADWGDEVAVPPQFVGAGALLVDERDTGIDMGDVSDPGFPNERCQLDLKPKHLTWENG